jgi:hypothetical protein
MVSPRFRSSLPATSRIPSLLRWCHLHILLCITTAPSLAYNRSRSVTYAAIHLPLAER